MRYNTDTYLCSARIELKKKKEDKETKKNLGTEKDYRMGPLTPKEKKVAYALNLHSTEVVEDFLNISYPDRIHGVATINEAILKKHADDFISDIQRGGKELNIETNIGKKLKTMYRIDIPRREDDMLNIRASIVRELPEQVNVYTLDDLAEQIITDSNITEKLPNIVDKEIKIKECVKEVIKEFYLMKKCAQHFGTNINYNELTKKLFIKSDLEQ